MSCDQVYFGLFLENFLEYVGGIFKGILLRNDDPVEKMMLEMFIDVKLVSIIFYMYTTFALWA